METKETLVFTPFQQWEIAFIYAFACTFNPQQAKVATFFKLPEFFPQDLENEIQKEESELIHKIICASLGNILNRKHPIESFKISFQQIVSEKMKSYDIDLEVNPLLKENFNALSVDLKLYLLHSLIEWQLQDSSAVRLIIEINNNATPKNQINPIKSYPLGTDSKKRTYWQFGDSCWIWRDRSHIKTGFEWETVCRNRQDLENLVSTLSSSSRLEKSLIKVITEEIYELADKEQQRRLRKERAEIRKLIPVEVSITRTTLRSRGDANNRVRYNYDDVDIFGSEDDEDEELDNTNEEDKNEDEREYGYEQGSEGRRTRSSRNTSPEKNKPIPTRWSSRLNKVSEGNPFTENLDDDMLIDSTGQDNITDMDTSPVPSEMDTSSPTPSLMETTPVILEKTPSDLGMETSRSQSAISNMDINISRPQSVMELQ